MRRRLLAVALVLLAAGAVTPSDAAAQPPAGDALDRAEQALAATRLTEARALLERWLRENPPGAPGGSGAERARALLLQGRLADEFAAAEDAYLAIVLGHPSSPAAPEALLRLGQGLIATGNAGRAAAYLERLIADYPGTPQRAAGLLWLARAQAAQGRHSAACATLIRAREAAADDAELLERVTIDDAACDGDRERAGDAAAVPVPQRVAEPVPPPPAATVRAAQAATAAAAASTAAAGAHFAVQAGAFRERRAALELAARLGAAGFDARVVTVEGSALWRVRVGRFAVSNTATNVARDVAARGFDAAIVSDVANERDAR